MKTAHPKEVHSKLSSRENVTLIDVRTPVEFKEVHVPIAEHHPLDQLDVERIRQLSQDGTQPVYVICKSGTRGKMATEKLRAAGLENIYNVEGGMTAWIEEGYDVVRGEVKVISLERQVRIAAGSLVLLGVLLGGLVHISFLGLAAFVGAGLIFAGVTDTCGMALMLSRMPWNQISCPKSGTGKHASV